MSPVLYALMCVLVPLLWGIFVVSVTNAIERRSKSEPPQNEPLAQDDQV